MNRGMTRSRSTLAVWFGFLVLATGLLSGCPGPEAAVEAGRDLAIQALGAASSDGHTITYTLLMTGHDGETQPDGSPAAPNVVSYLCPVTLTTTLPVGATLLTASGQGWDCTGSSCVRHACFLGQSGFTSTGGLPPVTLVATVYEQGPYENCATLSNGSNTGGWAEFNLTNNTSCVTATVPAPPPGRDLFLKKLGVLSADGQTVTYTISLTGTDGGTDYVTVLCPLTITDTLPPGATFVSSNNSSWWARTGSNYMPVWCSSNSYGGGPNLLYSLPGVFPPLIIVASVPPGETITNCASFTNGSNEGAWAETSLANNTSCVTNTIPGGALTVNATLDGAPWTGPVNFSLAGSLTIPGSAVPLASAAVAIGTYSLSYTSGGPAGASLLSTLPTTTQTLADGGAIAYTLNFRTNKPDRNIITVTAALDGAPWAGPVSFSVGGPQTFTGSTVPQTSVIMPAGTYSMTSTSGGPIGATFLSVSPATTQTLTLGTAITFTLNFWTEGVALGNIVVNATETGAAGTIPWTGPVSFTLTGPQTLTGTAASQTFANVPAGAYTLTYLSGGPVGAPTPGVTPLITQTLTGAGMATFTLNF